MSIPTPRIICIFTFHKVCEFRLLIPRYLILLLFTTFLRANDIFDLEKLIKVKFSVSSTQVSFTALIFCL